MRLTLLFFFVSLVVADCSIHVPWPIGSPTPQPSTPTPVPNPNPSPTVAPTTSYTGPATLQHGGPDGPSIYGQMAANNTFISCSGTPVPIAGGDIIYHNGRCVTEFLVRTAALESAQHTGSGATVSDVTVDGDTAIASYTRHGESGQILLTHSAQGWTAVTSVKRAFGPADNIGIDAQRLQTLQARVRANLATKP